MPSKRRCLETFLAPGRQHLHHSNRYANLPGLSHVSSVRTRVTTAKGTAVQRSRSSLKRLPPRPVLSRRPIPTEAQNVLKTWQLQHWAYLTGKSKPADITKNVDWQAWLIRKSESRLAQTPKKKIVSVDMGIRNLAFCVVDAPDWKRGGKIKVTDWKRVDLLESVAAPAKKESPHDLTPPNLAKVALGLTKQFLSYSPEAVLIERQRFRTGGGAEVQEWTIKVNMLESMLWACLETLKGDDATFRVHAVRPDRVAQFWVSPMIEWPKEIIFTGVKPPISEFAEANPSKRKVDKRAKIDVVRSWVKGNSDVELDFTRDTAAIAEAFTLHHRERGAIQALVAGGKLDDLADCLLQAVAWVKWQENRRILGEMWQQHMSKE